MCNARHRRRDGLTSMLVVVGVLVVGIGQTGCRPQATRTAATLENRVDLGRGQLQVGGPYAGIEFHHSRPLPSRISFYYPVANSIDLSTDYWQRDASMPFSISLKVGDDRRTLGEEPYPYRATPAWVTFENEEASYLASLSYRFAATLPLMALELAIVNRGSEPDSFSVDVGMRTVLRTSHAYEFKRPSRTEYYNGGLVYRASFEDSDADSADVFVLNAGAVPTRVGLGASGEGDTTADDPAFSYAALLSPGDTLRIVQLIGSCRTAEFDAVSRRARKEWREDVDRYERHVRRYALDTFPISVPDSVLVRTDRWSRAILAANSHYLDGHIVPMPTPAQYNFFFTHDLLLTDLGAVYYDTSRVAHDLRYIADLAAPDSVLPHAYYWRNGGYITEHAGSDNWNHLWFILLSSSYLKHSGDRELLIRLLPMIRQSMRFMDSNVHEGLMHSERPDWWDIGHVYGARSYL
ncbi:MAG: hypothetical protein R3178_08375, partial [Rhodothermales bacterium]|nr:hypothetical protein [Rhodothermales bacterium]